MGLVNNQYRYMQDLEQIEQAVQPGHTIPLIGKGPSPLRVGMLMKYLSTYPDQRFAVYICTGIQNGFHIGFDRRCSLRTLDRNHTSCRENPSVVTTYLQTELATGRLCGPIKAAGRVHTSPMGLIPKPRSDRWRLIVDLSSPWGASINDGIDPALCSLKYATMDNVMEVVRDLGRGTQLVKMDLSEAYRIVPIHPDDHYLLGIKWQGDVFIDRSLPFGLRSAPKIFTAVADSLAWALTCEGIALLHYLDDYLLFSPPGTDAGYIRSLAEATFDQLGVPIAPHKTAGPSTALTFLGIHVDTIEFQLSLPLEKVTVLVSSLRRWRHRTVCTKRELESLLGHLSHAATVIRHGRIFLRHLFSRLSCASRPHHFVRLDVEAKTDLKWWHCLLYHWNRRSFFPPQVPSVHIFSDASGSFGSGAISSELDSWFQIQWPSSWADIDISAKELVPIVISAGLWGPWLVRKHICFHADNEGVVKVLQKQHAKSPLLTHLLRCLYFYTSYFNFHYSAEHIAGVENVKADAISRNNLTVISSFAPQIRQTLVPATVTDFILHHSPDWGSPHWIERFIRSLPRA